MSRVLIIKTSSLGDVVHNLPIVEDIMAADPAALIDWVVEEAYADIPRMHPKVHRVIPVAQRRWRRSSSRAVAEERMVFETALQQDPYDLVLDTQGLLKSALLTRLAPLSANGRRVGFSRRWAREGIARLFYDRGYDVKPHLHAVERVRSLAAQALGYAVPETPLFGLRVDAHRFDWLGARPYVVLLHATSRPEKSWPETDWKDLIGALAARGLLCVLLYGSEREREVAERLARDAATALVAPRLTLPHAAALLNQARGVVGVDTGLTHLAAALDVPTVALFGATPRWRYAPYWSKHALSLGENGIQAAVAEVLGALSMLGVSAGA